MNNGWARIYRQIEDNPLWLSEKFTRGQAWIDMIIFANHTPGFFYVRGNKIDVERGQIAWSEVTMSKRWQWSRAKVRGFLKMLENEQQIEQQKNSVTSIITILNYEKYQSEKTADCTTERQQKDSRLNTNKNVKNVKNVKNNIHRQNANTFVSLFNDLFAKNYKVTDPLVTKLKTRLQMFSMDQILTATKHLASDRFNHGENDRGWVATPIYLLRSDDKLDEWLNKPPANGKIAKKKIFV